MQLFESMMCPDTEQTLYTVPLFWSGEGACSWPKNTSRGKGSDMINAAFVLAMLGVIVQYIHITDRLSQMGVESTNSELECVFEHNCC